MAGMRWFYEVGYRYFRMPWEIGVRRELVALVEEGRMRAGRALDLGCGTGDNALFLARHGFDVTGVDFAASAIAKARRKASDAGLTAQFVEDDLTALRRVRGPFDFLLDYGALDDLGLADRDRYVRSVVPLTRPGSQFLLWCFEWPPRWWERLLPAGTMAPGEVRRRFEPYFEIERVAGTETPNLREYIAGYAAYLMTRRADDAGGAN